MTELLTSLVKLNSNRTGDRSFKGNLRSISKNIRILGFKGDTDTLAFLIAFDFPLSSIFTSDAM